MKNKLVKIVSVALVLALVVTLCAALAGCNTDKKRREREARERAESVAKVEDAFLGVLDDEWRLDIGDADLVLIAAPGDYIVAKGWTGMLGDVLSASALQTAKLKNLASAMYSDEGKALLEDVGENAQLLLPVLRQVGFTKEDVSSLFYDLIDALIRDSGDVLSGTLDELQRALGLSGLTVSARKNVSACVAELNGSVPYIAPAEKQRMISAFEDARGAIEGTIGFAYDMFFGVLSDSLWTKLFAGDGLLDNISDSEVELVVSSMLAGVDSLKGALTQEQIDKLIDAFDLLIAHFDEEKVSSALFAQVIVYAKYVNMFVGVAPLLLDALSSAGKVISAPETIAQLRQNAGDWSADNGLLYLNAASLSARFAKDFMDSHTADELKAAFDGLYVLSGAGNLSSVDLDKAALLAGVDVVLNLSDFNADDEEFFVRHPDVLSETDLGDMFGVAFTLRPNLARFTETYRAYKRGEADIMRFISALDACGFKDLGVVYKDNEQLSADNIDEAYRFYMTDGLAKVEEKISALTVKAVKDIKRFIDDFYADGSVYRQSLDALASRQPTSVAPSPEELDEQLNAIADELRKSGMFGVMLVLVIILS